jgi:hypothetical protein
MKEILNFSVITKTDRHYDDRRLVAALGFVRVSQKSREIATNY